MSKGGHTRTNVPVVKTTIPIEKLQSLNKRPLTKKKQKLFLKCFAQTFNVSKAAYKAGISRTVVYKALHADDEFKKKFEEIKQAYMDTIEETSVHVALQADARGFNDRKLLLQAHRPEVYNPKTQLEINQTLTLKTAPDFVKQAFQGISLGMEIADAEVVEVDETDLKEEKQEIQKRLGKGKASENK